jgi:hypothetical protein
MLLLLLGISSTVSAHHSTAAYDYSKSLTLSGTVKDFEWTNPHMFIRMLAVDAQGKQAEWNIECGTPNINVRHGWKKSDINVGDRLTLNIHPMRDGSLSGTLITVTLPDGRLLYGPGNDIKSVGPPPDGPGHGSSPDAPLPPGAQPIGSQP